MALRCADRLRLGALNYLKRGVAGVTQDSAKIRLYEQVIETDQADVGADKPLSSAGLDALIEIARLDIVRGDKTDALERLDQVQAADKTYRATEVATLQKQAGAGRPRRSRDRRRPRPSRRASREAA